MVSIYILVDPRDSRIFYVGQTSDPKSRWSLHISGIMGRNGGWLSRKEEKFIEILTDFQMPLFVVIEEVDELLSHERELYWYETLKDSGAELTNAGRPGATRRKGWNKDGLALINGGYYRIIKEEQNGQGTRIVVEDRKGHRRAFQQKCMYWSVSLTDEERGYQQS